MCVGLFSVWCVCVYTGVAKHQSSLKVSYCGGFVQCVASVSVRIRALPRTSHL